MIAQQPTSEKKRIVDFLLHSTAYKLLGKSPRTSPIQKAALSAYNQMRAQYSAEDIKGVDLISGILSSLTDKLVGCQDVSQLEHIIQYIEGIEKGEVYIAEPDETTLDLVLKTNWFRMIESGKKKEEYREIKPFWVKRILQTPDLTVQPLKSKHVFVRFRLGYAKDAPKMVFRINGIRIGHSKPEWSDGWRGNRICIALGERIS